MKALIIIAIFSFAAQVQASDKIQYLLKQIEADDTYYSTVLTDDQKTDFKNSVKDIAKVSFDERNSSEKEFPGWKPADLFDIYFQNVNSLYLEGYATEQNVSLWKSEFQTLVDTPLDLNANDNYFRNEQNQYNHYREKYISIHANFINRLTSMPVGCAREGDIAGNKKCCSNHVKLIQRNESLPNVGSCKKQKDECSQNSQCCSGMCNKKSPNEPGVCLPQTYCSEIRNSGDACNDKNAICSTGECINLDISEVNIENSCKKSPNVCSQNGECCSGLCSNNRCVEVSKCMSCKKEGAAVSSGEQCCPGYIQLEGKCVAPMPIWVPTVKVESMPKKSNLLVLFLNNIFPIAHASTTEPEITSAQKALLEEKRNECAQNYGSKPTELDICLDGVNRLEANYKEDRFTGLTQAQTDEIAAEREKCTSSHATGTEEHTKCMADVDTKEKERLAENAKAGEACMVHAKGSEAYKLCMAENGVMGISLGKQDYVDKYQIPGVTAKTYSNMKECSFNSLNDSWRDASNKERNAEVFLRAFEYVFAENGTQDFWVEPGKGNIFSRANKVAIKFRENRGAMLKQMQEIDKTMACKCIAIFGPSKFSSAKQNFFNTSCEEEKKELQTQLGEDLDKGQTKGNIDGTSVAKVGSGVSELEKQNAATEEIDKGAIGLSHERLLVEWLQLRAEAQMLRFQDNSDLEKELTELSEFITNVDFNEVFKDRIQSKELVESDPKGDSLLLYKWGYTYRPGWFKIFSILTLGIVEGFIFSSFFDFDKGSAGSSKAAVTHGMKAAWRYHDIDEIDATPEIVDVKTKKKKCVKRVLGVCVKYMDGFHRYFLGPRFDNEITEANNRCITRGRASTCFKSGYRTDLNNEINYIMDPTRPLFVTRDDVAVNVMPGYSETFPQMLNTARNAGVNYLKSRKPGGFIKWGYRKGGDDFGNQDHLGDALKLGHFLPKAGNLNVKKAEAESGPDIKSIIQRGATKYAMCKGLKEDCNATTIQDPELIGFGYLFESTPEAQLFAEYVYEIHWKWSHLTKNDFMGYPLVGMDTYFKLAAYNMKLVGSLAASRSMQYAEAFQLYTADWEDRKGEYNSLGESAAGTKSRNLKYGEQFYATFGKLDFSGETNLEVFDAAMNSAISSGSFNAAEVSALKAGRSSAIRRNSDIQSKKNLEKAILKAGPVAKKAFAKNTAFLNKVNTPLSSFGMSKFGGGTGKSLRGLTNAIKDMNKNISSLNDGKGSGSTPNYGATFTMPKLAGFKSSGSSGSSYGKGTTGSSLRDSGLSNNQVDALLKNLKKEKNELMRNEDDTIFSIVSKAYKRNYSRVLKRNESAARVIKARKEPKINDKDKQQLKQLLEAN